MTRKEIFAKYLEWSNEYAEMTEETLFQNPVLNREVYETQEVIVSHLYFLIVSCIDETSRSFVFYEENTLKKMGNGDLILLHSTYKIPKK